MKEIDLVDVYEHILNNDVEETTVVKKNGEHHAVLLPYDVFREMRAQSRTVAVRAEDIDDEMMDAILNSEVAEECEAFDHEMKEQ